MVWNIYLSGEIHTEWREFILAEVMKLKLDVKFMYPVLDHESSDDRGVELLGSEDKKFWHDHKSAKLNAVRTQNQIKISDIVVVRFGEKYRQWNAAFDAGFAVALRISLIVIQSEEHQHALKEVDAMALAVLDETSKVPAVLNYIINGEILQ